MKANQMNESIQIRTILIFLCDYSNANNIICFVGVFVVRCFDNNNCNNRNMHQIIQLITH